MSAVEDVGMVAFAEAAVQPRRYKIRFGSQEAMTAAFATESVGSNVAVALPKRNVVSVEVPAADGPMLAERFDLLANAFDAQIVEDYRYALEQVDFVNPSSFAPEAAGQASLDDVVEQIGAKAAWARSRGKGVVLAIVDTGIDGTRPEFPLSKRHTINWAPNGEDPWTDWQGHGSMCACIAAGTRAHNGVFDGVAPDATIMSCRTYFYDTELAAIYDQLTDMANAGEMVIASNSFGIQTGTAPTPPADSDFLPALDDAIAAGVLAFFSAGNYHKLAGGIDGAATPNSIWLHKGREDLFTVGAAKPDGSIWDYSSRGPGQFPGEVGMQDKPDCVGITPPFGKVVFGSGVHVLKDGWGTSGCCPQAAGLAALIVSRRQAQGATPLSRPELFELIRRTSRSLSHDPRMQGHGHLDCEAALAQI